MTEITCQGCGRAVDDTHRVCPGCGAKLVPAAAKSSTPFTMAAEADVPTIDLEEASPEVAPPEPEAPARKLEVEEPKASEPAPTPDPEPEVEIEIEPPEIEFPEDGSPDAGAPQVEGEEGKEDEDAEPRGDTVQMSISDATKAWVQESGTREEPAAPGPQPASSNLPLLLGVLVVAVVVLTIALFLL